MVIMSPELRKYINFMESFPETRNCPMCGSNWVQGEISEDKKHLYAGTFFSRVIGVYNLEHDRTTHYQCPDCKTEFGRQTYKLMV